MSGPHVSQWAPIAEGTPCTCWAHRGGAPREIGEHRFTLEEGQVPRSGLGSVFRWRGRCSCGHSRPHWNYQSDSVAYHSWLEHVRRYS